jgi:hypothetical protein
MKFENLFHQLSLIFSSVIPLNLRSKTGSILKWIFICSIIRLILMPVFSHSDLGTTLWVSFTWINKNQLILSNDPPAIFFILGGFYRLMLPFFSQSFLNFINSGTSFTPSTMLPVSALLQPGINTVLLIAKLPFLFLDIASAFLMLHFFNGGLKGFSAFKMWLLNPVSIFVSYVFGQYDIFAVFFILLALLLLKRKKFGWSMLSLGIASSFKVIGIALMPLIVIYYFKNHKGENRWSNVVKLARVVLPGLLPLLLFLIIYSRVPQYYDSVNYALPRGELFNGFFGDMFFTRGTAAQPFFSGILMFLTEFSISFSTYLSTGTVYLVPLSYVLVLLGTYYTKSLTFEKTCGYFTIFLLSYYAFSLFLPQWFFWVQPFLIFLAVENRRVFYKLTLLIIPLYFVYIWQWDSGLTTNLLTPLTSQALFWPGPLTLMNSAGLPGTQIVGVFRTIFSALCVFIAFMITRTSIWVGRKNGQNESLKTQNIQ